ncbi:MAG TPA: excinuclease ABC subunit UvrA [bacterium]|nr:excinuclease ABC subunit UvrA [bacterium]
MALPSKSIVIKGARQHNLKNLDLEIPRDRLVVITGLSGSGKSSLAFDTLYAEGQRRYVESLSTYARQFLEQMDKPDVESITGLSPAIAIEQRTTSHNPRSTVGTVTEVYDYLRLLYARVGHPHCYRCGKPIAAQTAQNIVDRLLTLPAGTAVHLLAPVVRDRKGECRREIEEMVRQGFVRARIDGTVRDLSAPITLAKTRKHTIEVVVDRILVKEGIAGRLTDSVELALKVGDGLLLASVTSAGGEKEEFLFSEKMACLDCGISLPELSPRMFSFNSPHGACPPCGGLGSRRVIDPDSVVSDPRLTIRQGAIAPWAKKSSLAFHQNLEAVADHYGFDLNAPFGKLDERARRLLLYGSGGEKIRFWYERGGRRHTYEKEFEGVIPALERRYREAELTEDREEIERFMGVRPCEACGGMRLRPESLAVTVEDLSIGQVCRLSIAGALRFFQDVHLTALEAEISRRVLKEIRDRLGFMVNVGLDYLTLDRAAGTLSGGEAQRIRLATQIGSGLVGVLYILDEPSIGLHPRDNRRLLETLKSLRDLGNTVIVVEHDRDTILAADTIVDLGPGAGIQGGYLVAFGSPAEILRHPDSLTGHFLSGRRKIPVPAKRRFPGERWLSLLGVKENNLKDIDVSIPVGLFTGITGVSGSGKSTLLMDVLYKALARELYHAGDRPGSYREIHGLEHIEKVVAIDQSPIGRTPRSNPATYTGVFTEIRSLFAQVPAARRRGFGPGRFSFNVKGGRCEVCQGDGIIKIEMHFLPDVYITCEACKGKRFNRDTLEILYKGRTIAEVLEMTVEEAREFFSPVPRVKEKLDILDQVGLGYLKLGQSATTLSGGEAQRIKLAKELSRRSTGRTVFILDEPTTGLHFADVEKLLEVLNRLVEAGNTVVVIEHNLDVMKAVDYLIDLGPEGGDLGGEVIAVGTPEEVAQIERSYTGQMLRELLSGRLPVTACATSN